MKLKEIIEIIENNYPVELAYEWDNVGLFYGDIEKEISKVLVTLDITPDVIDQAVENDVDLVLSHHPALIGGIKNLSDGSMVSDMIINAVKNDICIYSAHTNMDTARNGTNQKLAEIFDLEDICVMENDKPYEYCGLGRVGNLKKEMSLSDFCELVKKKLNTPFVRVCGDDRKLKRVALASGSCSEYIPSAIKKGADVIVTADMKYHNCIEYVYDGIAIVDAGHFPTENIVKEMFKNILKETGLEIIFSKTCDIFKVK